MKSNAQIRVIEETPISTDAREEVQQVISFLRREQENIRMIGEKLLRLKFSEGAALKNIIRTPQRYGKNVMKEIAEQVGCSDKTLYEAHAIALFFDYDEDRLNEWISERRRLYQEPTTFLLRRAMRPTVKQLTSEAEEHEEPKQRTYGNPIDFRGLRHEPTNENGVVFLFGLVAKDLGFSVESVQAGFPDCDAKRQISPNKWKRVRIEFEYLSRNFFEHGHDPNGCDIIICWKDNWPDCPSNLEVIELSSKISLL